MSLSRREFLVRGSIVSGSVIVGGMTGAALPAQTPPRRRSLNGMAVNDPIISAWREGVARLKALPAADTFNWNKLSTIHGTTAGFNKCPHGNWYFLPWHRAYIAMYERKVRELTKYGDFALPYWDWTLQPTLPPAFASATYQGKPNPLHVPTRTLTGSIPTTITGSAVITQALAQTPYERFGSSRPSGQNSLAPSWITSRTGVQGQLEATPHNLVHNRIGGFMPTTQSPLDPIFMMHHGNMDRLWAVWNASGAQNSTDPLWRDMPFTANFFNNDGSVWSPKVSDLLQPEALGYTFGLQADATMPLSNQATRLEKFLAAPAATTEGVRVYRAATTGSATASTPLAVPIKIDPAPMKALAGRVPAAAGEEMLGVARQRQAEAALPRVLAVIRGVIVTEQRTTEVRVFLNAATTVTTATPLSDPSYVGTFGFFGGDVHAGHPAEKPSVMLDLTDAIGRLTSGGAALPDQLTVQLLPAGAAGAGVGTATPEAVEVVVIT